MPEISAAPPRTIGLRSDAFLLMVLLACAATLRLWSVNEGIPYALGVDEPVIIDHVVGMMKTGNLHPPLFDYPGLIFYLHLPVACLRFLKGAVAGEWTSLAGAAGSQFYLWSRVVTALFGVGTVYVVYRAGLRWGRAEALIAAAFLAFSPLHVRESRFVLTDVPMTFLVAMVLLLTLRAHESPSSSAFAWPALFAGLATSVKYTAGVSLLIPLIAALLVAVPLRSRIASAAIAVGSFVVGFCGGAPYALLDLPGFLNGFANLASQYRPVGAGEAGASVYLKHLRLSLAWPASLLAVIGIGTAAVQAVIRRDRVRWVLLVVFPLAYFFSIAGRTPIYGRYLLPIVPFVCLMVAVAIVSIGGTVRRLASSRAVPAIEFALVAIAILLPGLSSVQFVRHASAVPTQALAYDWLHANVPPGAPIILERGTLVLPADMYRSIFVRRMADKRVSDYRALGARYLVMTMNPPTELDADVAAALDMQQHGIEVVRVMSSLLHPGPNLLVIQVR